MPCLMPGRKTGTLEPAQTSTEPKTGHVISSSRCCCAGCKSCDDCRGVIPLTARELPCMPAIIYDFKAFSAKLRKQRINDWSQPWRPEPEPQIAKPSLVPNEIWRSYLNELINRLDPK